MIVLSLNFLVGCKYKPVQKDSISNVFVKIENRSLIPQFDLILKRKIKEEILMSGHFRIVESKRASDVVVRVKVDSRNRYGTVFEKADPILATAVNNEVLGSIEIVDKNKKPVEVPFKISAPSIRPTSYSKIILNKANMDLCSKLAVKIVRILMS
ncbi:MAG: hypothetical protein CBC16_06120 [Verrucomicrobia bacterium TMED56]|nr:MAG: hypothetical protein CBC16_06120 [Verrucomicrobia bacterium TMED56]